MDGDCEKTSLVVLKKLKEVMSLKTAGNDGSGLTWEKMWAADEGACKEVKLIIASVSNS